MKKLLPLVLLAMFYFGCLLQFSAIAQDIKVVENNFFKKKKKSFKNIKIATLNQNIELGVAGKPRSFKGINIKTVGSITLTGEKVRLRNIDNIECDRLNFKTKHVVLKSGNLKCNVLAIYSSVEKITIKGKIKISAQELKIECNANSLEFSKKRWAAGTMIIVLKNDPEIERKISLVNKLHYVITKEK